MKYSDIPKYTSSGNYNPSMSLDYFVEWLDERISEDGLQLNPDFQRGYVWTEEQQIKYIEHLLKEGYTAKDVYFNQSGWGDTYTGEFVCVDGLQRITAIQRFLNNEIKVFGLYLNEYEDAKRISRDIRITININNLKTRKEVLKWYIEFNSGGTIHTEEEIQRVIKLMEEEE